jgi:hypothetical protein
MGGENDDGDVAIDGANALEHFDAVELRHHQIQDHDVIIALPNLVLDERGIAHGLDDEAVFFEQGLHVFADCAIVIDDQDSDARYFDRQVLLLPCGSVRLRCCSDTIMRFLLPLHYIFNPRFSWA